MDDGQTKPEDGNCHCASGSDRRGQFGNRYLTNPSNVYQHNACGPQQRTFHVGPGAYGFARDNVEWDEEQEKAAIRKIEENSKDLVALNDYEKYENEASDFWHKFYMQHQQKFFKDRHWLFTEFEELAPSLAGDKAERAKQSLVNETGFPGEAAHTRIFEVGCGVGNTVFPVLQANSDKGIFMYCCDFAKSAVDLVKEHPDYDRDRCYAFLCDISCENPEFPFPKESLDIIVLIFVLSAIAPSKMQRVICTLAELLKPGGRILFRDYGRYDMAQLRFKNGKCLEKNFYVRGDGTRVYFFTQEELASMFNKAGLTKEQNYVDRRLQVNRGKQLKMYRVWIQCKYRKET